MSPLIAMQTKLIQPFIRIVLVACFASIASTVRAELNAGTELPHKPTIQTIGASLLSVDEIAKTVTVRYRQKTLTFSLTAHGTLNTASAMRIKATDLKNGDLADWKKGDYVDVCYAVSGVNLVARYIENRTLDAARLAQGNYVPLFPMVVGTICFLLLLILSFCGLFKVLRQYFSGKLSGAWALLWVSLRVAIGIGGACGLSFLIQQPGFGEMLNHIVAR